MARYGKVQLITSRVLQAQKLQLLQRSEAPGKQLSGREKRSRKGESGVHAAPVQSDPGPAVAIVVDDRCIMATQV
jgi:hypothetical protein